MSKTKLIRLYAKNATEVNTGSFECHLDSAQLSNVLAISLKSAVFNNNVYNIFTSGTRQNNVFSYELKTAVPETRTVSIPSEGYYTLTEILTIIAPLIETDIKTINAGDTFTMVKGAYSKKIEATLTGASTIAFDALGSLNAVLGNTVDSGDLTAGTYTFNSFPNLVGLESVTINLASKSPKTILNAASCKKRVTNSLGVIPVNVPFGATQTFTQPDLDTSMLVFSYPEDLTTMRFTVRDVDGNRLADQVNHLVIEVIVWFSLE